MEPARPLRTQPAHSPVAAPAAAILQAVSEAISRTRFGAVQLTIHEGRVVQIDITEKQRFT